MIIDDSNFWSIHDLGSHPSDCMCRMDLMLVYKVQIRHIRQAQISTQFKCSTGIQSNFLAKWARQIVVIDAFQYHVVGQRIKAQTCSTLKVHESNMNLSYVLQ